MWVRVDLKAPDEGEWVALTAVSDEGVVTPLGYIPREAVTTMSNLAEEYLARHEGEAFVAFEQKLRDLAVPLGPEVERGDRS